MVTQKIRESEFRRYECGSPKLAVSFSDCVTMEFCGTARATVSVSGDDVDNESGKMFPHYFPTLDLAGCAQLTLQQSRRQRPPRRSVVVNCRGESRLVARVSGWTHLILTLSDDARADVRLSAGARLLLDTLGWATETPAGRRIDVMLDALEAHCSGYGPGGRLIISGDGIRVSGQLFVPRHRLNLLRMSVLLDDSQPVVRGPVQRRGGVPL